MIRRRGPERRRSGARARALARYLLFLEAKCRRRAPDTNEVSRRRASRWAGAM